MYRIRFKKSAEREIAKLPNKAISQIKPVIDGLALNPRAIRIKKTGESKGTALENTGGRLSCNLSDRRNH
jgi:mRNA-degrading endonuclease RelE of RelBE toxin-antitoxin system